MAGEKWCKMLKIKGLQACFAFALILGSSLVLATSLRTPYFFDLKPQSLINALKKTAEQANLQLLLPHAALKNRASVAIKGEMSLNDALQILLKDHALAYQMLGDNMLVIKQVRSPQKTTKNTSKQVAQAAPQPIENPGSMTPVMDTFKVIGYRRSMAASMLEKRTSNVILDAITQQEIGKFPDSNVAESMQRLSGVTLDRGEYISIRGADPQMTRVQINGRTVGTTAAANRDVSFPIFGSELFQTIKVIKSTAANMDEGGIGGVVSLETPRPLTIGKRAWGVEMGANQNAFSGSTEPEFSLYLNELMFDDSLGVYLSFSQQNSSSEAPFGEVKSWQSVNDLDIVGGLKQQVTATSQKRDNRYMAIQWQVTDDIEIYGDYLLSKKKPIEVKESFETGKLKIDNLLGDGLELEQGSRQGTLTNAHFTDVDVLQTTRIDTIDYYQQGASLAALWSKGLWQFNTAAFYTSSGRHQDMKLARAQATVDLGYSLNEAELPTLVDVQPPDWQFNKTEHQLTDTADKEVALKFDASYELDNLIFSQVNVGIKQLRRTKQRSRKNKAYKQDMALNQYIRPIVRSTFVTQWPSLDTDLIVQDKLANTGFAVDLTKYRHLTERTTAAYLMADIDTQRFDKTLRGNLGVRWLTYNTQSDGYTTKIAVDGQQSLALSQINHHFTELLPSANLVVELDNDNTLRFSAGKVMSYSNFGLLVPDILIDLQNRKLDLGNADLQPNQGWQYDLSAAHYFADEGLLGVSLFYKKIDPYNEKVTSQQVYQVTQRVNGGQARLKGIEINVQTPLSFLPGFWQHFGVFANATFSDSVRRMSTGEIRSLPGQADFASNFVLYWEKDRLGTRLAYNYRDKALSTRSGLNGVDIYEDSREYIDLSVRYRFDNGLRLSFEVLNLNKAPLYQYQNDVLHPIYASVSQSRYYFGAGYHF